MTIRIYLDQKDFSRIGKGLSGSPHCAEDVAAYHRLLQLVEEDVVQVYFSWCHVAEALRYHDEKIGLLGPYCEAVDRLCRGRCLRWPPAIIEAEIDRFLAREYGVASAYDGTYPYGMQLDHLPPIPYDEFDAVSAEGLRAEIRQEVIPKLPMRKRKAAERRLRSDRFLKNHLLSLSDTQIDRLFPGFSFTRSEVVEIIFGESARRRQVLRGKFGTLGSFKEMIRLSATLPQLKKLGQTSGGYFQVIKDFVEREQRHFDPSDPDRAMRTVGLRHGLVCRFADCMAGCVVGFCKRHGVELEDAIHRIIKDDLSEVKSLNSVATSAVEYYIRHRGARERSRSPQASDLMDLQHVLFLPYVDIYSTDAFFAGVARQTGDIFGTAVVTKVTAAADLAEGKPLAT